MIKVKTKSNAKKMKRRKRLSEYELLFGVFRSYFLFFFYVFPFFFYIIIILIKCS